MRLSDGITLQGWVDDNRTVFSGAEAFFIVRDILAVKHTGPYDYVLTGRQFHWLESVKKAYLAGMPLAYILGKEEFYGREFQVSANTLIPRKETEIVVEKAVGFAVSAGCRQILDLCCGCGNIGITMSQLLGANADIFMSDLSFDALLVAEENARRHQVPVLASESDLMGCFALDSFDMVVSNPPYVETDNIKGSLIYEPKLALDGGGDGLELIRRILEQAPGYIRTGGFLVLEFGWQHKPPISDIIKANGRYEIREWIKDYDGNWRGVVLQRINER